MLAKPQRAEEEDISQQQWVRLLFLPSWITAMHNKESKQRLRPKASVNKGGLLRGSQMIDLDILVTKFYVIKNSVNKNG